jgi:isopentenyl-diphosphate Delta-isomerase
MNEHNRGRDTSHEERKGEHLDISLNEPVECQDVNSGLERYYFVHQALPELDLSAVDLSTTLFGKHLSAPIVISSMVGGIDAATAINRNLARAAQTLGVALGVGSQRCLIDSPELAVTYRVRDIAPDILLFANVGAVQLNYGFGVKECLDLVDSIKADVLILHLNPLQEALQPEGNTRFAGLLGKIRQLCHELPLRVIVKEVGNGISTETAARLAEAGAAGIDIAGAGGTCWSEIERRRAHNKLANDIAASFSSWGIPTAESILMARKGAPDLPIIASGGIRNGIDVAKAIALGADAAGIALPLLKAANRSAEEAINYLNEITEVLRVAMFCTGAANLKELKFSPGLVEKK